MKLTQKELQKMIKQAEKNDACEKELNILKVLTPKEVLKHPNAPYWACWYAKDVIKSPWEKGEDIILTSPEYACWYAKYCIKGRWEKGEESISSSPQYAYYYAKYCIKCRWEKGEKAIYTDKDWWRRYQEFLQEIS